MLGCGPGGKDDSPSVEAIEEPVDGDEKLVNDSLGNTEESLSLTEFDPRWRGSGGLPRCPGPVVRQGMWVEEVNQGLRLYGESGRTDGEPPMMTFGLSVSVAHESELPKTIDNYPKCSVDLQLSRVHHGQDHPVSLMFVGLILGSVIHRRLFCCDIGTGMVNGYWPNDSTAGRSVLLLSFSPSMLNLVTWTTTVGGPRRGRHR